ncbi:MAG: type III secretion system chaperone [Minwuiales bacterium]|nr:type III secretion system chaperone [Minwuiales bacterium]
MSEESTTETLFRELGPLFDPAAVLHDEAQSTWAVVIDDETRIDVAHDAEDEQLVFTLDLGTVPEEAASRVHELLLRFSFVWQDTGGLHGALDAEGSAVLMYKHPVAGLDVRRLYALLGNLAQYRELWADLIDRAEADDIDAGDGAPPFSVDGLRV